MKMGSHLHSQSTCITPARSGRGAFLIQRPRRSVDFVGSARILLAALPCVWLIASHFFELLEWLKFMPTRLQMKLLRFDHGTMSTDACASSCPHILLACLRL
jgi:hypothetical protein